MPNAVKCADCKKNKEELVRGGHRGFRRPLGFPQESLSA
jgi:hypothetical protein